MRAFLFLLSVLSLLAGLLILANANGALHQIAAFIVFLISAVLISGAAIVEAVNATRITDPVYFYATDAGTSGPHTLAAMRGLRRCGALAAETPVLEKGAAEWHPAADVLPDLFRGE